MAEPWTWMGVAALAISNVGIWIEKISTVRKTKANGRLCHEHGTRLTKLETKEEDRDEKIKELIDHNDDAHQKIFDKLGILG